MNFFNSVSVICYLQSVVLIYLIFAVGELQKTSQQTPMSKKVSFNGIWRGIAIWAVACAGGFVGGLRQEIAWQDKGQQQLRDIDRKQMMMEIRDLEKQLREVKDQLQKNTTLHLDPS